MVLYYTKSYEKGETFMKVAIEGMDGVGKTTVGMAIAERNNMLYRQKPLAEMFDNNIYAFDDEVMKAWFFGLGNLYSFLEYKDKDVVIDRHFASNYFWNGSERSDKVFHAMIDIIGVPDITIVLYASWNVRKQRLTKRDQNDYDLTDEEKMVDGYDKMCEFLDRFQIPYYLLNTEGEDIDTIIEEADSVVKNYKQNNKLLVK